MSKQGLESIEQWMWIVAGLVLAGLILVGTHSMIAHQIHQNELEQIARNFDFLKRSIEDICSLGVGSLETHTLKWPSIVNNVTIQDKTGNFGEGKFLCVNIEDSKEQCEELMNCRYGMQSLDLNTKKSLFDLVEKILGEKKTKSISFFITKRDLADVCTYWVENIVPEDNLPEFEFSAEAEECHIYCDCEKGLMCNQTTHLCES